MIWLPVVGFLVGFCLIWFKNITIPGEYASYLSLATIAGIDTILGGIRSGFEGKFQSDIFLSGFIVNTIMAAMLAYFGDQIGVADLYLAAVIVLGWRIFLNLSLIRRYALGRAHASHTPHAAPQQLNPSVTTSEPIKNTPLTPPKEAPPARPLASQGESTEPPSNPPMITTVEAP